mmetsp:Transcript_54458/g.127163  ORF Transcript_54458/g.127163 Transcript_54458/m.127163 type:complete len:658 (-) Transcript_54458:166-2139(-)
MGCCGSTQSRAEYYRLKGIMPGFEVTVVKATHPPTYHKHTGGLRKQENAVSVEAFIEEAGKERPLGDGKTEFMREGNPMAWNTVISLGDASQWDLSSVKVRFTLLCKGTLTEHALGSCVTTLKDLIEHPRSTFLISDSSCNPVLSDKIPRMPCEIEVEVHAASFPSSWPAPVLEEPLPSGGFPYHVFMMTRGTRGDVQPFVTLARGLATELGWLVTICTEMTFKDFVLKNSKNVGRGRIQFRNCGGDTEAQVADPISQWFTNAKSEAIQMLMLAMSEANFFNTCSTFVNEVTRLGQQGMPVNCLCPGFTLTSVGLLVSETCEIPLIGYHLQPQGIPSKDPHWVPLQAISSHTHCLTPVDKIEESLFTGHGTLQSMKGTLERNYFTKDNIKSLRAEYGLPDIVTWDVMKEQNVPVIIPMREDKIQRPSDWWSNAVMTDFIFLRGSATGVKALDGPVGAFVEKSKAAGAKLCLMTFSSMPVKRAAMLKCASRMVKECMFNLRLIYVGKEQPDRVDAKLAAEIDQLRAEDRFLDVERADFGTLFSFMDMFVVHGGLGTTVEALRKKKPVAVSGPLLMDQRFWGDTVHKHGFGPEPVHVDLFQDRCVEFANGALDPADPFKWQISAANSDWGADEEDGVKANVDSFKGFVEKGISPIKSKK